MPKSLPSRRRSRKGHSTKNTSVARLRDLLGISARQCAYGLGIKFDTYRKLEAGRLPLEEHHLRRFRLFAGADFDSQSNSWKAHKSGGKYTTQSWEIWEQIINDVTERWQEVLRPELENLLVLFLNAKGRHLCILAAMLEEFESTAMTSLNLEKTVRGYETLDDRELFNKKRGSLTTQNRIELFLDRAIDRHQKKQAMIREAGPNRSGAR